MVKTSDLGCPASPGNVPGLAVVLSHEERTVTRGDRQPRIPATSRSTLDGRTRLPIHSAAAHPGLTCNPQNLTTLYCMSLPASPPP
jgi:hypothetical protein